MKKRKVDNDRKVFKIKNRYFHLLSCLTTVNLSDVHAIKSSYRSIDAQESAHDRYQKYFQSLFPREVKLSLLG